MSKSFIKRITKEIQLYEKDNFTFPNLILKPSDDLSIWYFVVYNLDSETDFFGGVYIGKVIIPCNYPFSPPDFKFLTPSGRFTINTKLCTSFTGYHKELYSPSWNIASMCTGLISFMTDSQDSLESQGIGGIVTSKTERKKIADNSREYIYKNKHIKEIFDLYFKEYYTILKII
jgi:ubiquitin-protein ligase